MITANQSSARKAAPGNSGSSLNSVLNNLSAALNSIKVFSAAGVSNMATRFFEGDIFEVPLGSGLKGYFQYLGKDSCQLGGAVIRAFKNHYNENESPDAVKIVESPVDFHTHTVLQWGIKDKLWKKIGREKVKGNANEILFRDSDDYDDSSVKVSKRWRVWRVGGQRDYVGELKGEHRQAEIGSVCPPSDVVERMKSGRSNFFYPQFE